ncbi:MAG TPA: membrane protein insertase YidC, partial [Gemmatimonadales bacterium]|nr:membrane protein insertase YidC [Gemmatimonadales bacterium]
MDRRFLAAIGLMMLVVIAPTFLIKRPPRPAPAASVVPSVGAPDSAVTPPSTAVPTPAPTALPPRVKAPTAPEDTVVVRSGLYQMELSTRGARLIGARLLRYTSHAAGDSTAAVELVREHDALFGARLVAGADTLDLAQVVFTPSASEVRVEGPTPVTFTGSVGGHTVTLTYTFSPDDYQVDLRGTVSGLPATGGLLLVDLGHGIRNSEADSALNARDLALVVHGVGKDAEAIPFRKPDMGEHRVTPGPMRWLAVKSKYFVLGVFAHDSAAPWAAVDMERQDPAKLPHFAGLQASLPVGADGVFGWRTYAGPMEYPRLGAQGQGFNDVNPYGMFGIRTLIRPFALAFRWLIVWMHV